MKEGIRIINFILGSSGSGKSYRIGEIVYDELKSGSENIILIVPEQISFQTEKNMLDFLGNNYFDKINVLSFSRLFDFVSHALGIPNINIKSSIEQIVIMNQALDKVKSKLKIYNKNASDLFLAQLLIKTISDLKAHKVDKETLYKLRDTCNKELLKQKIEEIILIYEAYEELKNNESKDNFDSLDVLDKLIKQNKIFENYTVLFDEFTSFSNQQFSIIESILIQSKKVYMAFCIDAIKLNNNNLASYSLFQEVNKTILKIKRISNENHIEIKGIEFLDKNLRVKSQELQVLEKNIFRSKKENSVKIDLKDIFLYRALEVNEECDYIARNIKKLVIDKGYRYKDFAILTRDISNYSNTLKSSLNKYSLPYFLDFPETLLNKNLTNLIIAAFDAVHSYYSPLDVLRYLKSGLCGATYEEISILENYVLLWNIKGEKWLSDFSMHPNGWYQEFESKDIEAIEKINQIREKVINPLEKFKNAITSASGENISKAVYNLLVDIEASENLKVFCHEISKEDNNRSAEKYTLLWDEIMNVLDQMATIIGNTRISSKKYLEIFISSLNSLDLAFVPQKSDSVVIASIERTRLSGPKVVFVVGAAEGEFPKAPENSEIFTDFETEHLSSLGIEIRKNKENFLIKERFLAYQAVSVPSDMLFVTWHTVDLLKKNKLPSEIVKEIISIFPNIKVNSRDSYLNEDEIFSLSDAFEIYILKQNVFDKLHHTVKHYLYENNEYRKKCKRIEEFLSKDRLNFRSTDKASKLFRENITLSASQIERYYTCKFGYYCKYGLEIKAFPKINFGAVDYGTLMHFLFEKVLKKYISQIYEELAEEKLKEEIDIFTNKYISEKLGGWEDKPKSFFHLIDRFKKSIFFLMKCLAEEFKQSKFRIFGTELEIANGKNINPLVFDLPSGRVVRVEGKIDRVDMMKAEDKEYVRIIDYKTGVKEFKLSDVLYGLNMQMLIYLLTIHRNGLSKQHKNSLPGGVLYFKALKPVIDVRNYKDYQKSEFEIKKKLKMNGLVLENKDVILGMEKEAKGEFIPAVIKNEEIKKSDSLVSLDELNVIYEHIEKLIIKIGNNIFEGDFPACPVMKKGEKACKWCEYFSVCLNEDDNYIKLPSSLSKKEVLEKMEKGELLR